MHLLHPTHSTACRSGRLDTHAPQSPGAPSAAAARTRACRCMGMEHLDASSSSTCSGQHHSALASLDARSQPDHHPTLSPVQPPQSMNLTPNQAARVRRAAHLLHTELRLPRDDMLRLLPAVLRAPHFVQVRGRETAPCLCGRPQVWADLPGGWYTCYPLGVPARQSAGQRCLGMQPVRKRCFPPFPHKHAHRPAPCAEPCALAQVAGPGERRGGAPGAGRTRPAGPAARGGRGEHLVACARRPDCLLHLLVGWVTCRPRHPLALR